MVCLLTLGVGCTVLWFLFLFPPWGAVALTSVYVRVRALVLSGSLFVLLLVIVEVYLFQPGRFVAVRSFDGDSVCLSSLLLSRLLLDLTGFSRQFLDFNWRLRLRAVILCLLPLANCGFTARTLAI